MLNFKIPQSASMTLLTKINSKSENIAVIGLGYVGLPVVIEFCRAVGNVTGASTSMSRRSPCHPYLSIADQEWIIGALT